MLFTHFERKCFHQQLLFVPTQFCLKHPPPPYFKLSIFNRCGTAEALLSHLIVEKM